MFFPSSQHVSFRQQVIALSQSYPCPRCTPGMIEPVGLTETLKCNSCCRTFVPLRGGRLLYPAHHMGCRIAPTFWWDGYRWHWAGTTASGKQLFATTLLAMVPACALNIAITLNWWANRPEWCSSMLLTPLVALISIQLVYLMFWDFDFLSRKS